MINKITHYFLKRLHFRSSQVLSSAPCMKLVPLAKIHVESLFLPSLTSLSPSIVSFLITFVDIDLARRSDRITLRLTRLYVVFVLNKTVKVS